MIVEGRAGFVASDVKTVKENINEPELKIILYQSFCKKDKFERVLQKETEIGVSTFIPVVAEHSEKLKFNVERAKKIIKEAAEQSERGMLSLLLDIVNFEIAIIGAPAEKLFFWMSPARGFRIIILMRKPK